MCPLITGPFPQDFLFNIEEEQHLVGKITLLQANSNSYSSEISIVHRDGQKIHHHIKSLYNLEDAQEALDQSVQILSNFLRGEPIT